MTIKSDVSNYIKNYWNIDFEVSPQHFLSAELLIDGTDGMYFIIDFAEHFKIDFSEMDITRHFHCKHIFYKLLAVLDRVFGRAPESKYGLIDLSVADLIASVEQGKWSNAIYESRLKLA